MGYEVVPVSSGAIAVGANKKSVKKRPASLQMKQTPATVGQCSIMHLYNKFFEDYDKTIAQILLNADNIEQEEKKALTNGAQAHFLLSKCVCAPLFAVFI